eukprot:1142152-Pelagomonas_calceolata.AAC.1
MGMASARSCSPDEASNGHVGTPGPLVTAQLRSTHNHDAVIPSIRQRGGDGAVIHRPRACRGAQQTDVSRNRERNNKEAPAMTGHTTQTPAVTGHTTQTSAVAGHTTEVSGNGAHSKQRSAVDGCTINRPWR